MPADEGRGGEVFQRCLFDALKEPLTTSFTCSSPLFLSPPSLPEERRLQLDREGGKMLLAAEEKAPLGSARLGPSSLESQLNREATRFRFHKSYITIRSLSKLPFSDFELRPVRLTKTWPATRRDESELVDDRSARPDGGLAERELICLPERVAVERGGRGGGGRGLVPPLREWTGWRHG